MYGDERERFTDAELHAFFDRLFPHGWAGADGLADIAPEGWEQSPLLACFHPSVEQRYDEAVQLHRSVENPRPQPFDLEWRLPPTAASRS